MRVSQPRVSDLLRGRLDLFSTDALIDMLARLGVSVRLAFASSHTGKILDLAGSGAWGGDLGVRRGDAEVRERPAVYGIRGRRPRRGAR